MRVIFTDDDGNQESVTSNPVYVQTPQPLYGGIDRNTVPDEHDGTTAFTIEIYFSEEPTLGWEAVRDHVLGVTNSDVDNASRKASGSNIRWVITLAPDGNADVTVALSPTTDCTAQGAVCTAGGKMLSNADSITVPGPTPTQQQQHEEEEEEEQTSTDPPPAPTGLTATLNSNGSITISWTAPGDDSVTGYQILRRRPQEDETSLQVYVNDTGSTATSYTDTGTLLDTRYVYRVKARNSAGVGPQSNYVRIDK